jgi:hypothetical protein
MNAVSTIIDRIEFEGCAKALSATGFRGDAQTGHALFRLNSEATTRAGIVNLPLINIRDRSRTLPLGYVRALTETTHWT